MVRLRLASIALLMVVLVASSFAGGYIFHQKTADSEGFALLEQAHDILVEHGLKEPPTPQALEYGMIRGMLQAYDDPFTLFLEPPQSELQSDALEGKYGGIGAQLSNDAEGYWALFPYPDSPAQRVGIEEGDRLLEVDGQAISPQTPEDTVQSSLHGPVGKKVSLSLGRPPTYQAFQVVISREEIAIPSMNGYLQPGEPRLGVLKINLIAASTPKEIQQAVEDLHKRGATHFALDLRDNPGGLLTAGVDIARLFLEEGMVMQRQYRGEEVETFEVEKAGPLAELPLVILINQSSASAAEITAGALKARQRAALIGSPSYGKDTVQLIFNLEDGSSLHVTAARWWIPGLTPPLAGHGLQPDVLVESAEAATNVDAVIQAAIEYLFGTP